jgi:carbon monoxide dehydrogenase subunit G
VSDVPQVADDVYVDVPPETAFEYMDVPEHQAEITPSLSAVETVEQLPNGGKRATYTYRMAGVALDGEVAAVTHEPPRRIVFEMTGALEGTIEWTFDPEGEGVRISYAAEYDLPIPVLDRLAEPFVRKYNERELETTLRNLKTRLETESDGPVG